MDVYLFDFYQLRYLIEQFFLDVGQLRLFGCLVELGVYDYLICFIFGIFYYVKVRNFFNKFFYL